MKKIRVIDNNGKTNISMIVENVKKIGEHLNMYQMN